MEKGKSKFYGYLAFMMLFIIGIGGFGFYKGHQRTVQMESIAKIDFIIPLGAYDKVMPVKSAKKLCVALQKKKMALVTAGGQVTAFRYQQIQPVMESGLIAACAEGKYGYLDEQGKEQLPFLYDAAGTFKGNYAAVRSGSTNMVIDRKGKIIYQTKKEGTLERTEREGIFLYTENDKAGNIQLIDVKSGKELLPPNAYIWADYAEGFWTLRDNDANDVLTDENFQPLIFDAQEKDLTTNGFREGLAGISTVNGFCYADQNGKTVIGPFPADWGTSFSQGRACVWTDTGMTLIDKKGRERKKFIAVQDDPVISDFSEWEGETFADGVMPVRQEKYIGFIDRSGNWAISPVFDEVSNFSEGRAAVVFSGSWGIIGKEDADVL